MNEMGKILIPDFSDKQLMCIVCKSTNSDTYPRKKMWIISI